MFTLSTFHYLETERKPSGQVWQPAFLLGPITGAEGLVVLETNLKHNNHIQVFTCWVGGKAIFQHK
jgi:hypothetical protein